MPNNLNDEDKWGEPPHLIVHQHDDGKVYISLNGNTWLIEAHATWGISIETVGSSLIPYCPAIVERPDIVDRQLKEYKEFLDEQVKKYRASRSKNVRES